MLAHASALPRTSSPPFPQRERTSDERSFARIRSQVAVVLTLADQLARIAQSTDAEGLCQQLLEEVARLRDMMAPVSPR